MSGSLTMLLWTCPHNLAPHWSAVSGLKKQPLPDQNAAVLTQSSSTCAELGRVVRMCTGPASLAVLKRAGAFLVLPGCVQSSAAVQDLDMPHVPQSAPSSNHCCTLHWLLDQAAHVPCRATRQPELTSLLEADLRPMA
jgi:hypothetical protein